MGSDQIITNDTSHPFGAVVSLVFAGDYMQLPPIPESQSVPAIVDKHMLQHLHEHDIGSSVDIADPDIAGAMLLTGPTCHFRLRQLVENKRITDALLLEIVEHMGSPLADGRLSLETCRYLFQNFALTAADLAADFALPLHRRHEAFLMNSILATNNRDTANLRRIFSPSLGRLLGRPVFRYRLPLADSHSHLLTADEKEFIYNNNAETWGIHITGAPAYFALDNIATVLGVANGRPTTLHSLVFADFLSAIELVRPVKKSFGTTALSTIRSNTHLLLI